VGNERLTSSTGLVLLVLLAVETLTTIVLGTYLNVHLFLGLLLLPPVALKLASTGWRFARYYMRDERYVIAGPPQMTLRMLAPFLVASTLLLFGTGVAMIVVGHRGGELRTLHTFSFIAWGVLIAIHVLAYLRGMWHEGTIDWRRNTDGASARRALLVGALLAGVILAAATLPQQRTVLHHGGHRHHHDDG
jgi:multisubunit Na+/H+ antiporter MnhB subunit